jgi:hypothetical protein
VFTQHLVLLCDQKRCRKAYHGSCLSPPLDASALAGRFVGPCCLPGLWSQLAVSVAASAAAAAADEAAASASTDLAAASTRDQHAQSASPLSTWQYQRLPRMASSPSARQRLYQPQRQHWHPQRWRRTPLLHLHGLRSRPVLLPPATTTDAAEDDADNRWLDDRRSQGPAQVQLLPAWTPHCRP